MSRIFVSNLLQDEATLIIGGVTISYGLQGITVPTPMINKIEVRPKNPRELMRTLLNTEDVLLETDVTYEARWGNKDAGELLLTPVVPKTIRFAPRN
jgi:hypothetical protein